jgi:aspartyl/glutamyl-tRNA(Asn/Gln) amidotransferase C subunit
MDIKELEKIALICRIKLTEEEKKQFMKEFDEILKYFSQIEKLEGEEFKPDLTILPREDVVKKIDFDLLKNVPKKEGKYIKVPKNL